MIWILNRFKIHSPVSAPAKLLHYLRCHNRRVCCFLIYRFPLELSTKVCKDFTVPREVDMKSGQRSEDHNRQGLVSKDSQSHVLVMIIADKRPTVKSSRTFVDASTSHPVSRQLRIVAVQQMWSHVRPCKGWSCWLTVFSAKYRCQREIPTPVGSNTQHNTPGGTETWRSSNSWII